jgi:disulfide bond formation protein DsbB
MMVTIELIENVNYLLSIGGLVAILIIGILIYDLKSSRSLAPFLNKWGLLIAFALILGSSALTLVYSEIFGIVPCGLCWLERMALWPQVFLIGAAHYLKDNNFMPKYGIILSAIGLVISLYHHYLQMGGTEFVRCPSAGSGADCFQRFFFEFGFITFPLMAAILFALLIALYFYLLTTKADAN